MDELTEELTEDLLAAERAAWDANLAGDGSYYDRLMCDDALVVSEYCGVLRLTGFGGPAGSGAAAASFRDSST